jgi:hypothetical protein
MLRMADEPAEPVGNDAVAGEARWPMVGAVLAAIVLTILLPTEVRLGPRWLLPLFEGVLLVALIVADPVRISRRSTVLRAISIALVVVLVFGTLWATGQLIDDLIHGGPETNSATDLLEAGALVWVSNNIAFALLSSGSWTAVAPQPVPTALRASSTSPSRSRSISTSRRRTGSRASSTTCISDSPMRPPSARPT